MAIEDAVLWTGFITGILGAIGFFWQIYQSLSGRREEGNKILNRNVLRPWSELKVTQGHYGDDVLHLKLMVPKEALPGEVAPSTVDREGMEVSQLPGISKGESFLRKHDPRTFSQWVAVRALVEQYELVRERLDARVKNLVKEGMNEIDPNLKAAQWRDYDQDTYLEQNIIGEIESDAYWTAKLGDPRHNIRSSCTSSSNIIYVEVMGNNSLLKVREERLAVAEYFIKRLLSWISDSETQASAADLVRQYSNLEETVKQFRSALKEVAIRVDMTGA